MGVLLWIKNHKDNKNKILERNTVKSAFLGFIKFFNSKNIFFDQINNTDLHQNFLLKIDKFIRGQQNPPDNLIKLEDKFIHDN